MIQSAKNIQGKNFRRSFSINIKTQILEISLRIEEEMIIKVTMK